MRNIVIGKGLKPFLHHYIVPVLYNSTIISCNVQVENIQAKDISENKVAVSGQYNISLCYRNSIQGEEQGYQSGNKGKFFWSEKKVFSDIVYYEVTEDIDELDMSKLQVRATLTSDPECRANLISPDFSKTLVSIEALGEMKVEIMLREAERPVLKQRMIKKEEGLLHINKKNIDKELKKISKSKDKNEIPKPKENVLKNPAENLDKLTKDRNMMLDVLIDDKENEKNNTKEVRSSDNKTKNENDKILEDVNIKKSKESIFTEEDVDKLYNIFKEFYD